MRNGRSGGWWTLGVALAVLLGWGLEQAVVAPVESGAVYPPYSTLRTDPVGAKALYDSLSELSGIHTERLYKARSRIAAGTTLFVLGVDPIGWSSIEQKTLTEFEDLLSGGGRLVIGFLPVAVPSQGLLSRVVQDRWNITLAYRKAEGAAISGGSMPRETALYFKPGPPWRVLRQREGEAVAVEREISGGSMVLLADGFPVSNEGLREARDSALISTLAGPSRSIIFDENHFGVVENGSVTVLMEKYHLAGAAGMLALVAGLFLWRSSSSFLPPREVPAAAAVEGRDSLEGLSALLRRGVPENELLDTCYAEWSRSAGRDLHRERNARALEAAIGTVGKRDPVAAYRAACKIFKRERRPQNGAGDADAKLG